LLPAEHVIAEHYRLGSTIGILSRSFCNCDKVSDKNIILSLFDDGVSEIRTLEYNLANQSAEFFEENHKFVINAVNDIVRIIRSKK
jgi:hypothetical protein